PRVAVPAKHQLLGMGLRSCIALPIVIDGTAVGVVQLHSDEPNAFSDAEIALLRQVTGNITFSLQYLHSKESAQYLEFFDTLTALANRSLYLQRLDAMIDAGRQAGRGLALLVLDIAGLTVINDGLGHHAGDLLLQLVAERLKNTFGDSNCLCHLGSGRYVVAAIDGDEPESAATVLRERVDYSFDAPFVLNDEELRVSIKAGVAHYPDDGADAEALLQRAQTALDRAKRAGEQYLRHSPDMDAEASERLSMTNRLRRAVAEEHFEVHYQPKVDLRSRTVTGVEALLRWPSMTEGYVSPAVFVPMLESLGLIDAVGRWVIGRALAEGAAHFAACSEPLDVAVNVSPRQLRREEFVDEVLELIARVPRGSMRLELEVTESMLMADSRRAGAMLKRLRDAGVTVAIDDFGTGHSSLQILSRLPIDVLKIDRSFVRDLPSSRSDRLIVQTTITLASSLGMKTVAEGVETQEQLDVLADLGCDAVQGYLLHRPVPAAELAAWMNARKRRVLG
ncbi:MAG TPA: GGDEF domain-containing protein, partial [Gammaproteobacteria bacterium]|nr:GGDEF domain-containing protein [Gammaproteobacteria bacterium]